MRFIDTHCHLDFPPFEKDLAARLTAWKSLGIERFCVPAIGPQNWDAVLQLSEYSEICVALGYHPCFLEQYQGYDHLIQVLNQHRSKLMALGECGLDGRFPDDLAVQERVFDEQIVIAQQLTLPLIVHSVRCHDQTAACLKRRGFDGGGVIHAFSGSYQQASRFVDLGFKLGVGGVITWPRGEKTRKAISRLPVECLVLETDAPDMPLYQMTQPNNSPRNIPEIFLHLAELRTEPLEELAEQLYQNSLALISAAKSGK